MPIPVRFPVRFGGGQACHPGTGVRADCVRTAQAELTRPLMRGRSPDRETRSRKTIVRVVASTTMSGTARSSNPVARPSSPKAAWAISTISAREMGKTRRRELRRLRDLSLWLDWVTSRASMRRDQRARSSKATTVDRIKTTICAATSAVAIAANAWAAACCSLAYSFHYRGRLA
jgi:hypothetical protein